MVLCWLSTDPLAEKYPDVSPYVYCLNNPVRFIDPDGREVIDPPSWGSVKKFAKGFFNSATSMGVHNLCPAVGAYNGVKTAWSVVKDVYNGNYDSAKKKAYDATGIPGLISTVKKASKGDAEAIGSLSVAVVAAIATKGSVSATESAIAKSVSIAGETGSVASSATNSINLGKQLASEAQLSEPGVTLAGSATATPLRKAADLANEFGGEASDWVKKSSSSYKSPDGTKFETHWEENISTGLKVNQKTKMD